MFEIFSNISVIVLWQNSKNKNQELRNLFKKKNNTYVHTVCQCHLTEIKLLEQQLSFIQRSQVQILASNKSILQLKTERKGKEGIII
jgi:hypothetical protein